MRPSWILPALLGAWPSIRGPSQYSATLLAPAPVPADVAAGLNERFRTSPLAWAIAGALLLVAAYFFIRLLEWDAMNRETPDQDDPLL